VLAQRDVDLECEGINMQVQRLSSIFIFVNEARNKMPLKIMQGHDNIGA
jgi:hypothetical protein